MTEINARRLTAPIVNVVANRGMRDAHTTDRIIGRVALSILSLSAIKLPYIQSSLNDISFALQRYKFKTIKNTTVFDNRVEENTKIYQLIKNKNLNEITAYKKTN